MVHKSIDRNEIALYPSTINYDRRLSIWVVHILYER